MTLRQERRALIELEASGWRRHSGIGGSYWMNPAVLGDRAFSGRVDELLQWLATR